MKIIDPRQTCLAHDQDAAAIGNGFTVYDGANPVLTGENGNLITLAGDLSCYHLHNVVLSFDVVRLSRKFQGHLRNKFDPGLEVCSSV